MDSLLRECPKLDDWTAPGIPELLRTRILVNAVNGAIADLATTFSLGRPLGMRPKSLTLKANSGSFGPKLLSSLLSGCLAAHLLRCRRILKHDSLAGSFVSLPSLTSE